MTRYIITIIAVITVLALNSNAQAEFVYQEKLTRAIELAESNDRRAARQELSQIPETQLIQEGLAFLRQNRNVSNTVREFLFEILAASGAAKTDEGYRLFIEGLSDPTVRRWSVVGLSHVPTERRGDVVDQFVELSTIMSEADSQDLVSHALGILGRWGNVANPAYPQVASIFNNERRSPKTRSLAAHTMLKIGPAQEAVDHFERENVALCLGAIGGVGYETNGTFETDGATRQRIRQLVREGLRDADTEVRTHAFEALLPAYAHDFIVKDEEGGYRANSELEQVLIGFVASEPDEQLRRRAQSVLDTMDQRVRKAIRNQTQRENAENGVED